MFDAASPLGDLLFLFSACWLLLLTTTDFFGWKQLFKLRYKGFFKAAVILLKVVRQETCSNIMPSITKAIVSVIAHFSYAFQFFLREVSLSPLLFYYSFLPLVLLMKTPSFLSPILRHPVHPVILITPALKTPRFESVTPTLTSLLLLS